MPLHGKEAAERRDKEDGTEEFDCGAPVSVESWASPLLTGTAGQSTTATASAGQKSIVPSFTFS